MAAYPLPHPPTNLHPDPSAASSPPEQSLSFLPNDPLRPLPHMGNGRKTKYHNRASVEFRGAPHMNGGRAIPGGHHSNMSQAGRPFGAGQFDGPKSPPNTKNTSHVPCKFFKVGQCQAGKACPFSHDPEAVQSEQPCKYFQKGTCKFGPKCALLHVLPDGTVVNRGGPSLRGHLNLGGRINPSTYLPHESALGNSLLSQQASGFPQFGHQLPPQINIDPHLMPAMHNGRIYDQQAQFENGFSQRFDASYGSPPDQSTIAIPPQSNTYLTALDAPMPASFDSQGISHIARYGPVAASVPSKFGVESPPQSLPKKGLTPLDSVRGFNDSSFNREANGSRPVPLGSSMGPNEGYGQRMMHSQRHFRPRMISSSMPRQPTTDEWEDDVLFGGEEDYVPSALSHLLSAEEKGRRLSNNHDFNGNREPLSGTHTPLEISNSMRFGSPSGASPSRFSALFSKQREQEAAGNTNGNMSTSPFGHVGSPLRNSSGYLGSSPLSSISRTSLDNSTNVIGLNVSSPPRYSSTSMLSLQLQRVRLGNNIASSAGEIGSPTGLRPLSTRHSSNPRSVGTASRIDEEGADCVFSLDEEQFGQKQPYDLPLSPNLGPIGDGRTSNFSGLTRDLGKAAAAAAGEEETKE